MQLSAEQFEKILSALRSDVPSASVKDKRRRPRVGLRASVLIVETAARGKGVRGHATIRDVSREGIGLQRSMGMKLGTRFLVQFPGNEGETQSILCTVRHCEAVDSFWHIGATFIRVCNVSPTKRSDTAPMNADEAEAAAMSEGAGQDAARIRKAILS
jgi:PilZ domain